MMPRTANISGRSRRLSLYRRRQSTTRAMTSGDDIGRILGPVQQGAGALIELLATGAAAEPAIALGGALGSLRHSFRSAFQAPHPRPPLCERRPYTQPSPCRAEALARALTEPSSGLRQSLRHVWTPLEEQEKSSRAVWHVVGC